MLYHDQGFQSFAKRFGDNVANSILEEIVEMQGCGVTKGVKGKITLFNVYSHNMANHTIFGCVEHEDERFHFIIRNGNWGGTVVEAWGTEDDIGIFHEPKPYDPYEDDWATIRLLTRQRDSCNHQLRVMNRKIVCLKGHVEVRWLKRIRDLQHKISLLDREIDEKGKELTKRIEKEKPQRYDRYMLG